MMEPFMQLQQIDLNLLIYLDVLLDEAHIGNAAKRLAITQPALSNALKRLRESLGDDLLIRSGREMVLSPFAKAIRTPLKQSLLVLEENVLAKKTFDPYKDTFQFMTALHGYEEIILLPRLVQAFAEFPGLSILNSSPKSMHIIDDLSTGTIHFTATPMTTPRSGIMRCKLFTDEFVCVVHEKSTSTTFDLDSFCKQRHLLIAPHGGKGFIDDALARIDRVRFVKTTVGEFSSAPIILEHDPSLMTTVPKRLASLWTTRFPLKILNCPVPIEPLTIYLSWHVNMQNSPQIVWFKEQCLKLAST
jgi:DNA-binding transcriptional LysR family regulator